MKEPPRRTLERVLTFQFRLEDVMAFDKRHLLLGLAFTWIVGIGRYWDDPEANLLQHSGLGSVVYVFVLAGIVFLIGAFVLDAERWTPFRVLTFISLTSPPALLYAIPVERFMHPKDALSLNLLFLAVVAIYRLALLMRFAYLIAGTKRSALIVTLLPLCVIVVVIALLNLEYATLGVMGGLRGDASAATRALQVVVFLGILAIPVGLVLFLAWLILGWTVQMDRRRARRAAKAEHPPKNC